MIRRSKPSEELGEECSRRRKKCKGLEVGINLLNEGEGQLGRQPNVAGAEWEVMRTDKSSGKDVRVY